RDVHTATLLICLIVAAVRLSVFFFFSGRRRHTSSKRDWSSDVCSSDLAWKRKGVCCGPGWVSAAPGTVKNSPEWLIGWTLVASRKVAFVWSASTAPSSNDDSNSEYMTYMYSSARTYRASCGICWARPILRTAESWYEVTMFHANRPLVRWSRELSRLASRKGCSYETDAVTPKPRWLVTAAMAETAERGSNSGYCTPPR